MARSFGIKGATQSRKAAASWSGEKVSAFAGEHRCPVIGRISMDMIGLDVTDVPEMPDSVELLGLHQSVDTLAEAAGTIGYEILTSMGQRYHRRYRT